MRIISRVTAILGLLALLVGLGIFVYSEFEVWKQWIAVSANRSRDFSNPIPHTSLGTLIIAAGAFLAGLGLSMPKR